ncbi:MAG TPA: hypothetical protein VK522_15550 [Pseudolabrys sp.]|nr:hypothetical protein [Pseudolabrys sp.]
MAKEHSENERQETEQRLRRILRGTFAGPPTPLKDIPKKSGESRSLARDIKPKKRKKKPGK